MHSCWLVLWYEGLSKKNQQKSATSFFGVLTNNSEPILNSQKLFENYYSGIVLISSGQILINFEEGLIHKDGVLGLNEHIKILSLKIYSWFELLYLTRIRVLYFFHLNILRNVIHSCYSLPCRMLL